MTNAEAVRVLREMKVALSTSCQSLASEDIEAIARAIEALEREGGDDDYGSGFRDQATLRLT